MVSSLPNAAPDFASLVIEWQKTHGRNTLPWQNTQDPYRVWLSEIMLQQTQVATVLDYYARFLDKFPDVAALAAASEDEVLGLWSGLGYYSRARNMHRCAQQVMALHGGVFPSNAEALQTLPGIGRSTAAAVASFCYAERVAILDGNVKRVLSRVLNFDADLAVASNEKKLWLEATRLLPEDDLPANMPRYTQAVMDLGATICTTRNPNCLLCPVSSICLARKTGDPVRLPVKSRKLKRSSQSIWLLFASASLTGEGDQVLLERRPVPGVWAGLYCLPLFASREELIDSIPKKLQSRLIDGDAFTHVLTHKDLHLHPLRLELSAKEWQSITLRDSWKWVPAKDWPALGLPAPVRKLMDGEVSA